MTILAESFDDCAWVCQESKRPVVLLPYEGSSGILRDSSPTLGDLPQS